jgi:hypothetical protein
VGTHYCNNGTLLWLEFIVSTMGAEVTVEFTVATIKSGVTLLWFLSKKDLGYR